MNVQDLASPSGAPVDAATLEALRRLLEAEEFRGAGGVGSGNFGHAGRPGEVGGSAEGEPNVIFHGTSSEALHSIMKDGLVPAGGRGADAWSKKAGWGEPNRYNIGGRSTSVYMTPYVAQAMEFAVLAKEMTGGQPVVLEIHVPFGAAEVMSHIVRDEEAEYGVRLEGKIPSEWITRVGQVPLTGPADPDDPEELVWKTLAAGGVIYGIFVVDQDEPRAAGGAGSGNFGHAGRPGEVGGSAEDSVAAPDHLQIAQALSDYKQLTATGVNMMLRGDETNEHDRPMLERTLKGMDAAFVDDRFSSPLAKTTWVYRGIDSHNVATHMEGMKPGDVISDKAFMSTSRSENIARAATVDFEHVSVMLEIRVPKGERVVAGRSDEKELILNCGTRLELVRLSKYEGGENTLYAEMKVVK